MTHTLFDAHCDTISAICDTRQELFENTCHIDLKKMSKNQHIQFFASFIDAKNDSLSPFKRANQLINYYYKQIRKNSNLISHCNSVFDINTALAQNKTAALLSIEGGEALEGKLENLFYFFDRGVRMMTLCWNYQNELCSGVDAPCDSGITDFGFDVIRLMNKIGMLIDVSHMSEKSFWYTIGATKAPVVASHSNIFSLKSHKRNLRKEQIEAVIENNGCIGINLYTEFLGDKACTTDDVLRHVEYILEMGGENNVGIGTDFDGMSSLPNDISSIKELEKIPEAMLKRGYDEALVKKITHTNFVRIVKDVVK
ncbi:MAG: dipeptidase [Clostridia bacterium]|nr:dipeptidase [Clostridia bacterium]